ncbi:MAG: 6-carboxytetrahydropterin synthase QueD [Candidatus Omnitrophota bacterium]|nr:6-carboxytetrahydropterin synthase QueD [Candidatus Omnitrophota bacterium]
MYNIKIEAVFSAAHNLKGYKGKCEELHGHNWKVEVAAQKKNLDKIGMVLDFKYLKMVVNEILDGLDHKYLNKISCFSKVNPTSENIAKYVYRKLKPKISIVKSVTVWESENSSATYYE